MDDFDKQLEQILIHRKPEFWLKDIFSNLTVYTNDNYPYSFFYKKDNDILFEYDLNNESFYYNYYKIYLILRDKYHCNYYKINELIKGMVEEYLKLSIKTISYKQRNGMMILY